MPSGRARAVPHPAAVLERPCVPDGPDGTIGDVGDRDVAVDEALPGACRRALEWTTPVPGRG
ncbi:hypothetical protein GCM10010405_15870 [Streptomyces macrosporus]|uniref:Uncharacterized protein n=1 Tax=Streptomyces macrosporus TaxID=44032 RepID=A0ABN3JL44_9ACTN